MEDIVGNMMFALDLSSAINLTNMLYNREKEDKELDEMDISALSEVEILSLLLMQIPYLPYWIKGVYICSIDFCRYGRCYP